MKLYFSTKKIPALADTPLHQRLDKIHQAAQKLTGPEKLLLNLLKLLVIVPAFVMLLRVNQDPLNLLWAVLIFALYPLLIKPVQLSLSVKYLK